MFVNEFGAENWSEVQIILQTYPNQNKKYGSDVYRFGGEVTLPILLPRRGWEFVKKTRGYVYLKPPVGNRNEPFLLAIKIPSKAEAISIAEECYKKGESWRGQIGEWPAMYLHQRKREWQELCQEDGILKSQTFYDAAESTLIIGESGVWQVYLRKAKDGDFSFHETGNYVGKPELIGINRIDPSYLEGKIQSIELDRYERDPKARRACIAHYGTKCQICDFDFEKTYGMIGEGFIHVHHVQPISSRNGEYIVDPISDLIPLCANCHAMVHRRKIPFTVQEIKAILNRCPQCISPHLDFNRDYC